MLGTKIGTLFFNEVPISLLWKNKFNGSIKPIHKQSYICIPPVKNNAGFILLILWLSVIYVFPTKNPFTLYMSIYILCEYIMSIWRGIKISFSAILFLIKKSFFQSLKSILQKIDIENQCFMQL